MKLMRIDWSRACSERDHGYLNREKITFGENVLQAKKSNVDAKVCGDAIKSWRYLRGLAYVRMW